jgi:hypothetical protein
MAIAVICNWSGHLLLGKAREIADEVGERVVAISSSNDEESNQKLIYLGADEVLVCNAKNLTDWVSVVSRYVASESKVKMVLFPSDLESSIVMGAVYGTLQQRISPYLEGAHVLSGDTVSKKLDSSSVIDFQISPEKIALISLERSSVTEPFEDSSRFGKIRNYEVGEVSDFVRIFPEMIHSPSMKLVVLTGKDLGGSSFELAKGVAGRFGGEAKPLSGKLQVVYGPCLAIEVTSRLRDLPEFKGELLSISSREVPLSSLAKLFAVSPEIDRVLQKLSV